MRNKLQFEAGQYEMNPGSANQKIDASERNWRGKHWVVEDFVDKVIARSDAEDAGCSSLSYKVLTSATSWISLRMSDLLKVDLPCSDIDKTECVERVDIWRVSAGQKIEQWLRLSWASDLLARLTCVCLTVTRLEQVLTVNNNANHLDASPRHC